MKKITKIFLISLGVSLLAVALGLLTSSPAPAQAPPPLVRVIQASPWRVSNPLNGSNAPVPLMVGNADDPGRIPYQGAAILNTCINNFGCSFQFNNPGAGHRLVVQRISGSWTNTTSGATLVVGASDLSGASRGVFDKSSSTNQIFFDQPVQFYVDSGSAFTVSLGVSSGTSLGASIFVSGYLVDCNASPCASIAQSVGTF